MKIQQYNSDAIEDQLCIDLLSEPRLINHAIGNIRDYYFSNGRYKAIYKAIVEIYKKHKTIDLVLLKQELKANDLFDVCFKSSSEMSEWYGQISKHDAKINYKNHLSELKFSYKVRRLQYIGSNILSNYEQDKKDAKDIFEDFMDEMSRIDTKIDDIKNFTAAQALDLAIQESNTEPSIFPTPFGKMNNLIGGGISDYTIYAARTGIGKTTFATRLMAHGMKEDKFCLFFNTEMTEATLILRTLSPIYQKSLYKSRQDTKELENIKDQSWNINMDSRIISKYKLSVTDIKETIQNISETHKIDLVIIDYLQKIQPESTRFLSAYERISSVSNDLKDIQKYFNIPFLVLAQIKRLNQKGVKQDPTIEDLKGSGDIEQDSDNILIARKIGHTKKNNSVIQVDIHKLRHGNINIDSPIQFEHIGDQYSYVELDPNETIIGLDM